MARLSRVYSSFLFCRMARYWGCAVKAAAQSAFSASTASPEEL